MIDFRAWSAFAANHPIELAESYVGYEHFVDVGHCEHGMEQLVVSRAFRCVMGFESKDYERYPKGEDIIELYDELGVKIDEREAVGLAPIPQSLRQPDFFSFHNQVIQAESLLAIADNIDRVQKIVRGLGAVSKTAIVAIASTVRDLVVN